MANITIEIEIPEGWEFVRKGIPEYGEYIMPYEGTPVMCKEFDSEYAFIIVKPITPRYIILEEVLEATEIKYGEYYTSKIQTTPRPWEKATMNTEELNFTVWRIKND